MGCVYKKGDTWYIRYDASREVDGKRKQVAKACTGMTKRQAEQLLRETEAAIVRGEYQAPSHVTVETYLDEWLSHAQQTIAASTFALYQLLVRVHIKPALGKVKLDQLSPLHIQRFYKKLGEAGSNGNNSDRALSPKAIRNIHGVLHKALAQATRWGVLTRNAADTVDLPKRVLPDIHALSDAQVQQLMHATAQIGEWRLPILLSLWTGMRRGEVLALQWQDYQHDARVLIVRRALSPVAQQRVVVKETKSGRVRTVLINASLADELERHYQQTLYRGATDWICARKDGSHLLPLSFSQAFRRIARQLHFTTSLHGLRHTHATSLIAAGVPVKVVSERLGHANIAITQDVYTHVLPHMQRQAADTTETLWNHSQIKADNTPSL